MRAGRNLVLIVIPDTRAKPRVVASSASRVTHAVSGLALHQARRRAGLLRSVAFHATDEVARGAPARRACRRFPRATGGVADGVVALPELGTGCRGAMGDGRSRRLVSIFSGPHRRTARR